MFNPIIAYLRRNERRPVLSKGPSNVQYNMSYPKYMTYSAVKKSVSAALFDICNEIDRNTITIEEIERRVAKRFYAERITITITSIILNDQSVPDVGDQLVTKTSVVDYTALKPQQPLSTNTIRRHYDAAVVEVWKSMGNVTTMNAREFELRVNMELASVNITIKVVKVY